MSLFSIQTKTTWFILFCLLPFNNLLAQSPYLTTFDGEFELLQSSSFENSGGIILGDVTNGPSSINSNGVTYNASIPAGSSTYGAISITDSCTGNTTPIFSMGGSLNLSKFVADDTLYNTLFILGNSSSTGTINLDPLGSSPYFLNSSQGFVSAIDLSTNSFLYATPLFNKTINSTAVLLNGTSYIGGLLSTGIFQGGINFDLNNLAIVTSSLAPNKYDAYVQVNSVTNGQFLSITSYSSPAASIFVNSLVRSKLTFGTVNLVATANVGSGLIKDGATTVTGPSFGGTDLVLLGFDYFGQQYNVKLIGGPASETATSIITDLNDDLYIAGLFGAGVTNLDPNSPPISGVNSFTATGIGKNAFIAKYDAIGNFLWARHFAPGLFNNIDSIDIAIDALYPNTLQLIIAESNVSTIGQSTLLYHRKLNATSGTTSYINGYAMPTGAFLFNPKIHSNYCNTSIVAPILPFIPGAFQPTTLITNLP